MTSSRFAWDWLWERNQWCWLFLQLDEYLAERPELKKKIEEDTKNQNWYLPRDIKA